MVDAPQLPGNPRLTDRRVYRRHEVLCSSVVSASNTGRVLNISPDGVALQTDDELLGIEYPEMRLRLFPPLIWLDAPGRVAWKNSSRNLVGIQFIGIADDSRKQIQTWIASISDSSEFPSPSDSLPEAEKTNSDVSLPPRTSGENIADNSSQKSTAVSAWSQVATKDYQNALTPTGRKNVAVRLEKLTRFVGLLLTGAVLVSVLVLGGDYLLHPHQKNGTTARTPVHPTHTSQGAPSVSGPVVPLADTKRSIADPNFVLQVGAMLDVEKANALANSLRELSFPAFIVKQSTDRFYYIFVGPYDSDATAIDAQKQLERRGFPAVRTRWRMPSR